MGLGRVGPRKTVPDTLFPDTVSLPALPASQPQHTITGPGSDRRAYNIAMIDLAERLGKGSPTLHLWANLYRQGAFRTPQPYGSWQAADDLLAAAKLADRSASGALADALERSNRTLAPLADPLAADFGAHRWLSSEREEAYSDWFGWILDQIGDAGRVLSLFGLGDKACASEKPVINREVRIPDGRLDLVVKFGDSLLVVVEIKTKAFDPVAVRDQLARYARLVPHPRKPPHQTFCLFAAVDFGEFDCPLPFEPLAWRELALRIRKLACEWVRASKGQPSCRNDLIRAAMALAFCGAVEQNLLGLSGQAALFKTRSSAEYLEEWSART